MNLTNCMSKQVKVMALIGGEDTYLTQASSRVNIRSYGELCGEWDEVVRLGHLWEDDSPSVTTYDIAVNLYKENRDVLRRILAVGEELRKFLPREKFFKALKEHFRAYSVPYWHGQRDHLDGLISIAELYQWSADWYDGPGNLYWCLTDADWEWLWSLQPEHYVLKVPVYIGKRTRRYSLQYATLKFRGQNLTQLNEEARQGVNSQDHVFAIVPELGSLSEDVQDDRSRFFCLN